MNKKKNLIYLTTIPDFTRTVKKINFHQLWSWLILQALNIIVSSFSVPLQAFFVQSRIYMYLE